MSRTESITSTSPISDELRALVTAAIERGETQASIARASGVARSKICDWLNGRATMTLESADRVAAACLDHN